MMRECVRAWGLAVNVSLNGLTLKGDSPRGVAPRPSVLRAFFTLSFGWICFRDWRYQSTSGTTATRHTAVRATRAAWVEWPRIHHTVSPRSISLTSASRTRVGMSAKSCSLTVRLTRTRTARGFISMSMVISWAIGRPKGNMDWEGV